MLSVVVVVAAPLAEFTAVTVTPGTTAPDESRTDPVRVAAAATAFGVADGSTLSVGADATAGGFAGAAGDRAVEAEAVARRSLRCDPALGSVGRALSGSPWANVTTFAPRSFEGVGVCGSDGILTTIDVELCDAIAPESSGKLRFTRSDLDPRNEQDHAA